MRQDSGPRASRADQAGTEPGDTRGTPSGITPHSSRTDTEPGGTGIERDPEAILKRLEWTVIRRLDGLLQGDYRTLFRGAGLDLADLREYRYGDDIRSIDWNVTARLDVPYIRQFNEDREITAWFLLDMSPSVDFGASTVKKRTLLTEFTGVMARLLTRHGNRTGAMFFGGEYERIVPARGGRDHVLSMLRMMLSQPELPAAPPTDLSASFATAMKVLKGRSLVFIVSDFMSVPGWGRQLEHLTLANEVLAVRLIDPLETVLPDIGLVVMQDAETGEQLVVDTHDRGFRERFSRAAARRAEELERTLRETGVDRLELSTEDDLAAAIVKLAASRKERRRYGSRGVHVPGSGRFGTVRSAAPASAAFRSG